MDAEQFSKGLQILKQMVDRRVALHDLIAALEMLQAYDLLAKEYEGKKANLDAQLADLNHRLLVVRQKVEAEYQARVLEQQDRLAALREEQDEVLEKTRKLQEDHDVLRTALEEQSRKREEDHHGYRRTLEVERGSLQAACDAVQTQLSELHQEQDRKKTEFASEADSWQQKIDDLRGIFEGLKARLNT